MTDLDECPAEQFNRHTACELVPFSLSPKARPVPIIETSEKIVRNQLKNRWMRRADKNNAAYSANAAKGLFQTCRHGLDRPNRSVLPSENAYQVISNRAVHFNHAANIGLPRRPLN